MDHQKLSTLGVELRLFNYIRTFFRNLKKNIKEDKVKFGVFLGYGTLAAILLGIGSLIDEVSLDYLCSFVFISEDWLFKFTEIFPAEEARAMGALTFIAIAGAIIFKFGIKAPPEEKLEEIRQKAEERELIAEEKRLEKSRRKHDNSSEND